MTHLHLPENLTIKKQQGLIHLFADYANSCGAKGLFVTENDELETKMTELLNHNGPALLEIKTNVNLI